MFGIILHIQTITSPFHLRSITVLLNQYGQSSSSGLRRWIWVPNPRSVRSFGMSLNQLTTHNRPPSSFLFHVNSILATKKHDVVLLTRNLQPSLADKGIDVRVVDYTDHESLVFALQGVHTVISAISAHNPPELYKSQVALLEAAKKVGAKRFAPSEFAGSVRTSTRIECCTESYKETDVCQ